MPITVFNLVLLMLLLFLFEVDYQLNKIFTIDLALSFAHSAHSSVVSLLLLVNFYWKILDVFLFAWECWLLTHNVHHIMAQHWFNVKWVNYNQSHVRTQQKSQEKGNPIAGGQYPNIQQNSGIYSLHDMENAFFLSSNFEEI